MRYFIISLLLGVLLTGCHKELILKADVVSMTDGALPKGAGLKEAGPVKAVWCQGDDSTYPGGGEDKDFGYIDQVTYKAQKAKKGKAQYPYITDARYYLQGSCVYLEGTGAIVKKK